MKKHLGLFIAASLICISSLLAQEAPPKRQTPAERTKTTMEKLASFNLDTDAKASTEVIFTDFYTAQQKAVAEMRASGNTDRDAMMAKRQELVSERDGKLKKIFTADQMKTWTNEIEPTLRPKKPANAPAAAPNR